jgi:hypothetical protein
MTTQLDHFETALLTELRSVVEERQAPRRRRRRFLYAGVAAAAVAGLAFATLSGPGTTPAYAFSEASDGTVHVEVGTDATPEELEAAFFEHGITADVTYLEPGLTCDSPRGTPGTMPSGPWTVSMGITHDGFSMTIPAGYPVPGDTLVLAATRPSSIPVDPDAPLNAVAMMGMGFVAGDVSPCDPVAILE